jgi:murein DD-endopeptidase MepM/ murein hydrolase activator NlpD
LRHIFTIMGKKKGGSNNASNKKRSNKKKAQMIRKEQPQPLSPPPSAASAPQHQSSTSAWNFVLDAGPGCYIARRRGCKDDDMPSPDWVIEWEDVDPDEFDPDEEVPDIAVDTEERTLSICNVDEYHKVAYVTVYEATLIGSDGTKLVPGTTTNNHGETQSCITFIVLCPPSVFVHLCYVDWVGQNNDQDITDLRIESDVSKWKQHPRPTDEHPYRIGFPLLCRSNDSDEDSQNDNNNGTSFLCTQGEGGELTHFFSGNLHAIDFQCPIGTPILAVADGVVVESKDNNTLTGIAVTNLFEWNSILMQICRSKDEREPDSDLAVDVPVHSDGDLFVEYVHISKSLVGAGDKVSKGQVIGYSGSVGFSPEPHLHFSAFRSSDPEAPTVRVLFDGGNRHSPFLPTAGEWYSETGRVTR